MDRSLDIRYLANLLTEYPAKSVSGINPGINSWLLFYGIPVFHTVYFNYTGKFNLFKRCTGMNCDLLEALFAKSTKGLEEIRDYRAD